MFATAAFGASSTTIEANAGAAAVPGVPAVVRLRGLVQAYDGSARSVQVATEPANLPVVVTYNGSAVAPVYPGDYTVKATIADPLFRGSATETLTISITALVRHSPTLHGGVDGSMQVLAPENIVLAGDAWMSGDLLVPGMPALKLHGAAMVAGVADDGGAPAPTNGTVSLSDRAVIGYLMRRIDPIAMTDADPAASPTGTTDVTVSSALDLPVDFSTVRDLTLENDAGEIDLPPGSYGVVAVGQDTGLVLGHAGTTAPEIYNLESLDIADGASLRIAGPVWLVISEGAHLDGTVGDACHPEWLSISVASGSVSVDAVMHGYILAPHSTVTVGAGARLIGQVSSDRLVVQANAILEEPRL